jgi:hypothetical protein
MERFEEEIKGMTRLFMIKKVVKRLFKCVQ